MAFHIILAWLLLFNIMDSLFQMLEIERTQVIDSLDPHFSESNVGDFKYDVVRLPDAQLPPLTSNLLVEDVPNLWKEELSRKDFLKSFCNDNSDYSSHPCEFAWISCRVCKTKTAGDIHNFLLTVTTHIEGWRAEGNPIQPPRAGWVAFQPNASFGILLKEIEIPIRTVTILAMKSYCEQWMGSKLKLSLEVIRSANATDTLVSSFEIEGYHEEKTSVLLKHKFQLAENNYPMKGGSLQINATLIGGSAFKISGMALCIR
jgi:hypothetical protein